MKKVGVVIILIGLVGTLLSKSGFVTNAKMVATGKEGLMMYREDAIMWPPWIGIFIMAIGTLVYIYGAKKQRTDL